MRIHLTSSEPNMEACLDSGRLSGSARSSKSWNVSVGSSGYDKKEYGNNKIK